MSEAKIINYETDKIECNLCHRWMLIPQYERHYERCLDIQYLENIAKEKGESFTRKDLEECTPAIIDKLLAKYPPEPIQELIL